jgi:hypothetical protein
MGKQLTTPLEIKEEIVRMLQTEKVYFKGRLPFVIKDLPKRYTMPSYVNAKGERIVNKYWAKARTTISNSKRPSRVKAKQVEAAPREERVEVKDIEMTISLPSNMTAKAFIDFVAMIKKSGAKYSL